MVADMAVMMAYLGRKDVMGSGTCYDLRLNRYQDVACGLKRLAQLRLGKKSGQKLGGCPLKHYKYKSEQNGLDGKVSSVSETGP